MMMRAEPAGPRYEMTDDDRARRQRIAEAWKAYNGELDPPLRRMPGQPDDNVLSNRCQPIVDAGVDFLFGDEIEISVSEQKGEEEEEQEGEGNTPGSQEAAQKLLDRVWGRKEKRLPLLQDLAMNGAVAGTAFLRLVPLPDRSLRLVVVDPATVCVQTAPQDCETVLCYCIEYATDELSNQGTSWNRTYYREEITRRDPQNDDPDTSSILADRDTTWQIQHWTRIGERGRWTPAGPAIVWPYPFPPIFACKNLPLPNSFWGKPDITQDLIGMNNALNLLQSNINRVEKLYAAPLIYAPGTSEQVLSIEPGKIIQLALPENKIESVQISTDIANALRFSEMLRSDMDEQSHVPGIATGRMKDVPHGNISGVALSLLYMPLIKKTAKKRCLYGALIIEVSQAILRLAGLPDLDISIAWQNPLPPDDLAAVQAAIAKKQIGVSNTTLQRELGYDPDEEAAIAQQQQAEIMPPPPGQGMMEPPPEPETEPTSPFIGRA